MWSKYYRLTDWTIRNFRATKCVHWRISSGSETSFVRFLGFKMLKFPAGHIRFSKERKELRRTDAITRIALFTKRQETRTVCVVGIFYGGLFSEPKIYVVQPCFFPLCRTLDGHKLFWTKKHQLKVNCLVCNPEFCKAAKLFSALSKTWNMKCFQHFFLSSFLG